MQPPDRLALLYRISQTFNSSLDLDQVLDTVMDEVIAITRAERGFLMLRAGDGGLTVRTARGMDQRTINAPEFLVSRSVVERVARDGQPLLTSNAQSDAWLGGRASIIGLGLRAILCVPLLMRGSIMGVIYVDSRLQAGIFSTDDLGLLSSIAASAAIAIENARLYQIAIEEGRMQRELQMAHQMQASLLPRSTPRIPGWEVASLWRPARKVAGDFYDFTPTDRRLGFVIGDVCDKGMPAALFMALSRTILRASLTNASAPASSMRRANRLICADSTDGMFVTLFYGRVEVSTGEMLYVNAGHNPPTHYLAGSDEFVLLDQRNLALGIEPALHFSQQRARLAPGDFILMCTDGVTDSTNSQGEQFGLHRMQDWLAENRRAPAESMLAALDQTLHSFIGAAPQFDDITAVLVRRLPAH